MNYNIQNTQFPKIHRNNSFSWLKKILSMGSLLEISNNNTFDENREIIENIKSAKKEWINANINFDFIKESEIIDYYTYKIKACEIKYQYYLKKAKERGLRLEQIDDSIGMNTEDIFN